MSFIAKINAKKVINPLLVIIAVTVLAVFAIRIRSGATADSVTVLKTAGMTCGSCSAKITKVLEAVKGVAMTEVDVEGGWVLVSYDTKIVKPEALAERVTGTGFNSNVYRVLTPEEFRQMTGRNIGQDAASAKGGCGGCCGK